MLSNHKSNYWLTRFKRNEILKKVQYSGCDWARFSRIWRTICSFFDTRYRWSIVSQHFTENQDLLLLELRLLAVRLIVSSQSAILQKQFKQMRITPVGNLKCLQFVFEGSGGNSPKIQFYWMSRTVNIQLLLDRFAMASKNFRLCAKSYECCSKTENW